MKVGDRVMCVNLEDIRTIELKKGQVYVVEEILDDLDKVRILGGLYFAWRFKLIKKHEQVWNKPRGEV